MTDHIPQDEDHFKQRTYVFKELLSKIRRSITKNQLSAYVSKTNLFKLRRLTHKEITQVNAMKALEYHVPYYNLIYLLLKKRRLFFTELSK